MKLRQSAGKPWFRVKRYGYGVGLPIAWQGWAVLALYLGVAAVAANLLGPLAAFIVMAAATATLIFVAWTRSDGEWRYRNGE